MNSRQARTLVAAGRITPVEAIDALLCDSPTWNSTTKCPECESDFFCSAVMPNGEIGRVNTCSDECQRQRNMAIWDLDDGLSIIKISDLTVERAGQLLDAAGLTVAAKKVLVS